MRTFFRNVFFYDYETLCYSGGVHRDWVGVPRQIYRTGLTSPQCVCVNDGDLNDPQLSVYENCDKTAASCNLGPLKKS